MARAFNDGIGLVDPVKDLRRYENNPRLHPKTQIDKLARAIDDFGFLIPVLIDNQNNVLAGHARLEAAAEERES